MKIIILGSGQVGSSVATHLAAEANNSITVVDTNAVALRDLQERLDIRTLCGVASHPDVLKDAGAEDADMLLAVTNSDESNMVACQVAWTLFHTPTKIARIRATGYQQHAALFDNAAIPVDVVISPETLVKDYIARLIEYPEALQVLDFAEGRVRLVGIRAHHGGPLVGRPIRTLREHMPTVDMRVAAIFRRDSPIHPEGETIIEDGDEVFFVATREHSRAVMGELRRLDRPYRRLMIAGGGNIGRALARTLEESYQIKVIEHNPLNARRLAEELDHTMVLNGDATDAELLAEENIEDMDVFLALTNDDEDNILSSMLAKRLGARKVMCIVNRAAYVDLIQSGPIDIALSPHQITIGALLTHLRRGDVVAVHSLRHGAAEAIEIVARGDEKTSKVVGRPISKLDLPPGTTIGALAREGEVVIAHGDTVIRTGDHVILFLTDKRRVRDIEQLFAVGFAFF